MQGIYGNFVLEMAIIFGGASVLGTLFVWLRQPIILAYIALGLIAGPDGLKLFADPGHIEAISHMGIILLMFLLGLHLHPRNLWQLLQQTAAVTLLAVVITTAIVAIALITLFGISTTEAVISGVALSFSSTVISLKLIPTTTLHHKRTGEVMISILLFEDILAILAILLIYNNEAALSWQTGFLPIKTALFALAAWWIVRFIALPLFKKFDTIPEYIFLVSLGWCFTAAEIAKAIGLSYEIGAFFAGVAIATSPVSLFIAEGLKPLREFFLILFFFSIGAQFDIFETGQLLLPIILLAAVILIGKPLIFRVLLTYIGKATPTNAMEMGLRLGQSSEFSLLLASGALSAGKLSHDTAMIIETAAIITFILSTYLVVFKLPTPISPARKLRQD
ncbi:cation:proton antiporter [Kistimonas scapharcae]|uniref:Cation:proton antiporter n=2 Tax=Kistimonas scapharcae TaxID=1036133 RepID=A0ABP8UXM2_9GAMM